MTSTLPFVRANLAYGGWIVAHSDESFMFFPSHQELMRLVGTYLADTSRLVAEILTRAVCAELVLYDHASTYTASESEPYQEPGKLSIWSGGHILFVRGRRYFRPQQALIHEAFDHSLREPGTRNEIFRRIDAIIRNRLEGHLLYLWISSLVHSQPWRRPWKK